MLKLFFVTLIIRKYAFNKFGHHWCFTIHRFYRASSLSMSSQTRFLRALQNLCCKKKKFWQGIISMCFVEQASGLVLKQNVKQFLKGHGLVLCTYLVLSSDKLRPRNSLVKFRSCPSLNHCIEGAGTPLALQSITWYE